MVSHWSLAWNVNAFLLDSCYGWKWHFLAKAKSIIQNRKTFITLLFFQKIEVFVFGVVHGDPIFAQVGLENGNF